MLWNKNPWLRQVSLAASAVTGILVPPENADQATRTVEKQHIQEALARSVTPYGQLPQRIASRFNCHPAVLPKKFIEDLGGFHEALALALDDIINRWWTDNETNLPSRMPLDPRVEALLRWVALGSQEGFIRPYKGNQGNLRPDILIPESDTLSSLPFRVCEINGRFPINYLHSAASAYEALANTMTELQNPSFGPASDYSKLFDGLLDLFDPSAPIHFVSEFSDLTDDSPLFGFIEEHTGMRPRSVKPSSLRLIASETSPTGFDLYCETHSHTNPPSTSPDLINLDGKVLEKVHQIALQLHDTELFALSPDMIRHIAMRSVNDVRSVFLAHDKRILGIIRQELDTLVHKREILTPAQAQLLRDALIPTFLPGSPEAQAIADAARADPSNKDGFIAKPVRLARGAGIVVGKNLSAGEWCAILENMTAPNSSSGSTESQYVLQPFLPLRTVNWFWDEERGMRKSRMVGTYYSVNGRFVGLGMWRTGVAGEDVISASTKEVTVVPGVVYLGDGE